MKLSNRGGSVRKSIGNVTSWIAVLKNAFTAFINVRKEETYTRKSLSLSSAVAKRVLYLTLDYWLTALEAVLAVWLYTSLPFTDLKLIVAVWLMLWAYEIVIALFFIVQWRVTGIDITLSEDWRRAIDVISAGSQRVGRVAYWTKILKAVIWDGPEEIVIFCHRELRSKYSVVLILLCVTSFQAAFWGGAFVGGYELFIQPIIDHLP